MKKILHVAELGNPLLRTKAKPVKDVFDPEIRDLIESMILTMEEYKGVGIAAPQVYEPLQIFVMRSRPVKGKKQELMPTAIINPKIVKKSKKTEKGWEGCLSIPGLRAEVVRPTEIEVEYTDQKGKKVYKKFKNFLARVFQHEYDHLQGVVYLDRVKGKDIVTVKEFEKIVAQK